MEVKRVANIAKNRLIQFFRIFNSKSRKTATNSRMKTNKVEPLSGWDTSIGHRPLPNHSSTPKFPKLDPERCRSIYENVNLSYDSAYDSDGYEDKEFSNVRIPWIDDTSLEKENFDNHWNCTLESLILLSNNDVT